jgi:hypothetical protein
LQRGRGLLTLSTVLALSGSANALEGTGLTLETGSPDALCPALETANEVVKRRLGSLVVEGRWRARYTIAHAPSGHPRDFVRLELFNPEGGLELVRDLPMEGESCRTMAEVIALVLDRHFRGIAADEAPAPASDPSPAEPVAAGAAPAPSANTPLDGSPGAREREPAASAFRLAFVLADWLPEARPSAGVRALLPVSSKVAVGGELGFDLTSQEEPLAPGGGARSWQMGSRVFVAWTFESGPWHAYAGPAWATALERGTTFGVPETHSRFRVVNSLGLDMGFHAALGRRWFFTSTARLDWRIPWASGRFIVDEREVLTPARFAFGAGVGFGYAFQLAGEGR